MTILTFLLVIVGLAYLIRLRARTIELENRIEQLTLDRATNAQLEALRAQVIALERASPPRASQPAPTAQEFVAFLRAAHLSGPASLKPSPIELFLASHPAALAFVQAPKPVPVSFAKESFFAVNAYKFINASGVTQFGRYRIVPEGPVNI